MSILLVLYLFGFAFAVVFVGYLLGMDELNDSGVIGWVLLSFIWPLALLVVVGMLIANAKVKK